MATNRKKEFVIIGLGRFGGTLCKELVNLGIEVLAIDKSMERIQEFSKIAPHAIQVNAIDEEALRSLGVRNFDCVVISFGEDIQSSILATLMLKEMGVKQVWVKARSENHQKVLEKIGADRVIHPERDMAKRIAHHIVSDKVIDFIELSEKYSIVEIIATTKIAGKTLLDLDARAKYGCTIVAIKRADDIYISPPTYTKVEKNDILVTIGSNENINRFEQDGV